MEEEKIYLNYGDQQVDQAQLLTNMANQVQNYVNPQSWSGKRKQKFMDAYTDLVNKGLRGATNTSGRWQVEVGGDVDVESMDRKDREMYQEAAYFIQQQMQGLATAKQAEEEAKKAEMQKFDFLSGFAKHLNNTMAGGQQLQIGGENDQWNYLDERGTNGLRGINNRANKLADMLQAYSDSLDASKLDFTDTPYQNLDDFKAKVNTAITALRSGDINNIRPTLNAIGLNPNEFFYDGSGDQTVGADGNPITYAQQAQVLAAEEAAKAQEAQQQAYLEAQANKGVLNWDNGIHSKEARISPKAYAEFLSNTYGVGETGFNNINAKIQELIEGSYNKGLSAAKKKELGNLLYYIRTNNPNYKGLGFGKATNLSDADWEELRTHTNHLSSVTRENFVRLPWKTSDGRITYADNQGNLYFLKPANRKQIAGPKFTRSAEYNNYKNNFLSGTSKGIDMQHQQFLQQKGFTKADIAELSGIAADIVSIVDPEPISALIAAQTASGARDYARGLDPAKMTIGDWLERGWDHATGLFGAIPIFGDATLAVKTASNVAKWARRIGTGGALIDMCANTPGAYKAIMKTVNGEELTVEDWKNIGQFFRGFTATHRITSGNRAARQVLKKRGYDVQENSWAHKVGIRQTDIPTSKNTVKINIKGKETEVPISEQSKIELDAKLRKAGNNQAKKDAAIREVKEVKEHISNNNLKVDDITANTNTSVRNKRFVPHYFANTSANYGIVAQNNPTNPDVFNTYLENRGIWDKFKYGSNRRLRNIDKSIIKPSTNTESATETNTSTKTGTTTSKTKPLTTEEVKELRESLAGKRLSTNPLKSDEAMTVEGFGDVYLMDNKNGTHTLELQLPNGNKFSITSKETDIKQNTAKFLKETLNKININAKSDKDRIKQHISLELIKKLKSVGALKQGGKITDTQIDNFLNQYK